MTECSGKGMMLLATLFFTVTAPPAYGQDSPLKVEIKTMQAVVKNAKDFDVSTKIENISKEEQLLHLSRCSSMYWTADNPAVHVKQIFCKKNPVMDIRLKPGEAFESALPVRIEIPVLGLPQPVTFRLGINLWYEAILLESHPYPPSPSTPVPPIWSNAVTVNIQAPTKILPREITAKHNWYGCQSDAECVIITGNCDVEWAANKDFAEQTRRNPPRADMLCKKPLEFHPANTVANCENSKCVLSPRGFYAGGTPILDQ